MGWMPAGRGTAAEETLVGGSQEAGGGGKGAGIPCSTPEPCNARCALTGSSEARARCLRGWKPSGGDRPHAVGQLTCLQGAHATSDGFLQSLERVGTSGGLGLALPPPRGCQVSLSAGRRDRGLAVIAAECVLVQEQLGLGSAGQAMNDA